MADFPAVMPHHGLVSIVDDVWHVQGSVNFKPLVRLPRNMVVLRHAGELTLINSVRMNAVGEAALEALGKVAHVVKIGNHSMDDAYYADRFGAKRWALPTVAEPLGAEPLTPESLPHPKLSLFTFELTNRPEAALFFKCEGGLLITCDSVQHWVASDLMSPLAKVVTKVMGFQHPAQIGPPWRKGMTPEEGSLRPDFDRLVAVPFERLIGGHGGLCSENASDVLKASIERVYPT